MTQPIAVAPAKSDEELVAHHAVRMLTLVELLVADPVNRVLYRALQRLLNESEGPLQAFERVCANGSRIGERV